MGHDDHGDWFRHEQAEGLPQAEHASHVSPAALGISFVVITFGVLALILVLVLFYQRYTAPIASARTEGTGSASQYLEYRAGAQTRLGNVTPIDRANGVYRIPIDRAMQIVVEDYAQEAVAAGTGG